MWHADRGRLLLWTHCPVTLELAYVLLVETYPFFRTCRYFFGLCSSNISILLAAVLNSPLCVCHTLTLFFSAINQYFYFFGRWCDLLPFCDHVVAVTQSMSVSSVKVCPIHGHLLCLKLQPPLQFFSKILVETVLPSYLQDPFSLQTPMHDKSCRLLFSFPVPFL